MKGRCPASARRRRRYPSLGTRIDPGGFGGITLAQNVATREEVDLALSKAIKSGGTILKPAQVPEWGGYSGYFADPDGHPWEIAWNPQIQLEQGCLVLPD